MSLFVTRIGPRDEYSQQIIDYWTQERMDSAISLDVIVANDEHLSFKSPPESSGIETVLTPSAPPTIRDATHPEVAGKVFFSVGTLNYMCSGSTVNAANKDCVATAGHCLYDYERQQFVTNFVFIPHYESNGRPYGTFTARKMGTKQQWMSSRDFNNDVGIAVMNTLNGRHLQDATGALGITLNAPKTAMTNSFGFPKNLLNGEIMSKCTSNSLAPTFVAGFIGMQLANCPMTGGCSGGPWVQGYNTQTKLGNQVSVNSFIISNRPNNLFGPHFVEGNMGSLYTLYQNQ